MKSSTDGDDDAVDKYSTPGNPQVNELPNSDVGPMGSRILLKGSLPRKGVSKANKKQSIDTLARNRRLYFFNKNRDGYLAEASSQYAIEQPRIYNRLVRMHQTPSERQQASLSRGWADIILGQERLGDITQGRRRKIPSDNYEAAILYPDLEDEDEDTRDNGEFQIGDALPGGQGSSIASQSFKKNKAQGLAEWNDLLKERFLSGSDPDFNYPSVDENTEWDDIETIERDCADDYFADAGSEDDRNNGLSEERSEWETGIQDF